MNREWGYCPECGHLEYASTGYDSGRICNGCGQEWFHDVDYSNVVTKKLAEIERLRAENVALRDALEVERMRLAACGTAALGYFEGCKDEYRSASLDDVLRLYAENATLRQALKNHADAEPVAWMWQHEETGTIGFVGHDQDLVEWGNLNPRLTIIAPLYTSPRIPELKEPVGGAAWTEVKTYDAP